MGGGFEPSVTFRVAAGSKQPRKLRAEDRGSLQDGAERGQVAGEHDRVHLAPGGAGVPDAPGRVKVPHECPVTPAEAE